MTVVLVSGSIKRFTGLSGDSKPTSVPNGSTFLETDTGVAYITSDGGANWTVFTIGQVGHNVSAIADNRKVVATAGTRETLAASTSAKFVVITAETDNTGVVVVGGSTVVAALGTRRGKPLNAGESLGFPLDNLADVYLDVTVNGDGVTYVYLT
ncbi:MAG: hypothetical protein WC683_13645 [bacterium]